MKSGEDLNKETVINKASKDMWDKQKNFTNEGMTELAACKTYSKVLLG